MEYFFLGLISIKLYKQRREQNSYGFWQMFDANVTV